MVLQYPANEDFYNYAGNLNTVLKNYGEAAFYYRKLFMLNNNPQVAQMVFQLYLKADDPLNALKFLQYSTQQQQAQGKVALIEIIKDEEQLKLGGDIGAKQRITTNYKLLGVDEPVK